MIHSVGKRVIAKKLKEETTINGIILPDSAKKKQEILEVVSCHEDEQDCPVETGDLIIIDRYAGQIITLDDQEYVVVKWDEIVASIT